MDDAGPTTVVSPDKVTLKQIWDGLTVPMLWKLGGTLSVAVVALLGLGYTQGERRVMSCSDAKGYPVGRWIISGTITAGDQDALTDSMRFETPMGGSIETGDDVGTFQADMVLNAGQKITWKEQDSTGYEGRFTGVVSESGCTIEGNWSDNQQHRGTETLVWMVPKAYWMKRP